MGGDGSDGQSGARTSSTSDSDSSRFCSGTASRVAAAELRLSIKGTEVGSSSTAASASSSDDSSESVPLMKRASAFAFLARLTANLLLASIVASSRFDFADGFPVAAAGMPAAAAFVT